MVQATDGRDLVTPDYVRLMARYGTWQNRLHVDAANTLDQAARDKPRGAFFGSITATMNHLLWADGLWMSRLAGVAQPGRGSIADSVRETESWQEYRTRRARLDEQIVDWSRRITAEELAGALSWNSAAAGGKVTRPLAILIVHFFNHATHHRGQVHAMLTAAGARPGDTDLFLMPEAE